MFDLRPVPKCVKHKRGSKTQRQRGRITKQVYADAYTRSGGRCERCGRHQSQVWTLEAAHVERRWRSPQGGITAFDVLMLCGPSTDSRTCHHWADYTREGREWMLRKREEFLQAKVR